MLVFLIPKAITGCYVIMLQSTLDRIVEIRCTLSLLLLYRLYQEPIIKEKRASLILRDLLCKVITYVIVCYHLWCQLPLQYGCTEVFKCEYRFASINVIDV